MDSEGHCISNESTLLECPLVRRHLCYGSTGAGVRCKDDRLRVKNISATIINTVTPMHTVMVSWVLQNSTLYLLSSFNLRCLNDKLQHSIELSVDNETFMAQLGGLFSSATYYICCVSAVYGSYVADEACNLLLLTNKTFESASIETKTNTVQTVSGVLGCIIVVLLIVIAVCGSMLLFLLRSKSFKR